MAPTEVLLCTLRLVTARLRSEPSAREDWRWEVATPPLPTDHAPSPSCPASHPGFTNESTWVRSSRARRRAGEGVEAWLRPSSCVGGGDRLATDTSGKNRVEASATSDPCREREPWSESRSGREAGVRWEGVACEGGRWEGVGREGGRGEGLGCEGVRVEGVGRESVRGEGVGCDSVRREGVGWDGVRREGVGCEGRRGEGVGCEEVRGEGVGCEDGRKGELDAGTGRAPTLLLGTAVGVASLDVGGATSL